MEFFNGPVERWVKSEKTPCCLLRGLPWRFLKFQIHWSLAVPNSTPTPPPWPEITFLVSFSPTGYSLTFGQPALAIGQTTYQADTWPMGKQIETQVQRSRKTLENHTHLYQRMIHEKGSTNRSGWTIHWQTVQLQLERVAPKFWTTFSIVLSVAEVAERNPFASILSRTLLLQIFRSVFPPQPTQKKMNQQEKPLKSKPETSPPSRNKKVPAQKTHQAWLAGWTFSTRHLQDDIESRIGLQGRHLQLPCDKKGPKNTRCVGWTFELFFGWVVGLGVFFFM